MRISSSTFMDGSEIPRRCGYKTRNVSPALQIDDVPPDAESLALIMDDPDAMGAVGKVWTHWLVWNISPKDAAAAEGSTFSGAREGVTDFGKIGYGGPAPPDKRHTYIFRAYALNYTPRLAAGAQKRDLEAAIRGHAVKEAVLKGTFAP